MNTETKPAPRLAMLDPRFAISREFTGHRSPQFVLRFCGDFLGSFPSRKLAASARMKARIEHQARISA